MNKNIKVKRIYDKPAKSDGRRVLVDRLWPRGVAKADAQLDLWAKELAPPRELVSWFHADREQRWAEFKKKYQAHLKQCKEQVQEIRDQTGQVTFVTAVKDEDMEHSQIPLLLHFFVQQNSD